ncbi:alpha/beta fold hydrolase [Luteococcus sp. H138]|uniref:alpha/beta fold hydrolase n=1 Tax=unclassified Luteococcus TaxID=2639923 RepID=UPI00313B2702
MLQVSHGHQVYWESSGNPSGIPVLYLHGGPGGTLKPGYRRHFDPDKYLVIGLQQRGAGRSTPHAASDEHDPQTNTTAHLLADIEALRSHLGIDRWLVCGVSWGSTLALHHALAQPDRVLGLVLVAVTTTSPAEVDWISEGVGMLYPEAWERLANIVTSHTGWRPGQGRLVTALADALDSPDPTVLIELAVAWMSWEQTHIQIGLPADQLRPVGLCEKPVAEQIGFTRLVSHYWSHHAALDPAWVPDGGLLPHLGRLAGLPICMIHGRRDVSGPVSTPWAIKEQLPEAQLHIVESEGHGGERMMELWCRAADSFAERRDFSLLTVSAHHS